MPRPILDKPEPNVVQKRIVQRWITSGISPLSAAVATAFLLCGALSTMACPYCESEIGRMVAGELFNNDFWTTSLNLSLPFPILLAIVILIRFGPVCR